MVVPPSLAEDLSLIGQLTGQILAKVPQSVLELFLEGVKNAVHVVHRLDCLLLVLLNFAARKKEKW